MLDSLPDRELICGFLSGKEELLNWEPSDLFQFYYDTKPLKGCLDELLPLLDKAAVERAVKIGACNIYHGCVHNMLYEKNEEILKSLYKSAVFVIQASCFKNTGTYVKKHRDLAEQVGGNAEKIIRISAELKRGNKVNFKEMSEILFQWAKGLINEGTFEQGYEKLEKNIIDVVKEQQSKLGYRKEKIRLYYPRNSLKHFFSNVSEESWMKRLPEDYRELERLYRAGLTDGELSGAFREAGGFRDGTGERLVSAPLIILDDAAFLSYCGQIGAPERLDGVIVYNEV